MLGRTRSVFKNVMRRCHLSFTNAINVVRFWNYYIFNFEWLVSNYFKISVNSATRIKDIFYCYFLALLQMRPSCFECVTFVLQRLKDILQKHKQWKKQLNTETNTKYRVSYYYRETISGQGTWSGVRQIVEDVFVGLFHTWSTCPQQYFLNQMLGISLKMMTIGLRTEESARYIKCRQQKKLSFFDSLCWY